MALTTGPTLLPSSLALPFARPPLQRSHSSPSWCHLHLGSSNSESQQLWVRFRNGPIWIDPGIEVAATDGRFSGIQVRYTIAHKVHLFPTSTPRFVLLNFL